MGLHRDEDRAAGLRRGMSSSLDTTRHTLFDRAETWSVKNRVLPPGTTVSAPGGGRSPQRAVALVHAPVDEAVPASLRAIGGTSGSSRRRGLLDAGQVVAGRAERPRRQSPKAGS